MAIPMLRKKTTQIPQEPRTIFKPASVLEGDGENRFQVCYEENKIKTREGASAEVITVGGGETIRVRDAAQKILFEYRPESGKGVFTLPQGDLIFNAPNGNIDLVAGKKIRLHARETLSLMSARKTEISCEVGNTHERSTICLEPEQAVISGRSLKIEGDRGLFSIRDASFRGEVLSATLKKARACIDCLETECGRLIERARNVYRYVAELNHLKTRRMRTQVEDAFQLDSGRTDLQSQEETKIRGSQIHLG